MTDSSDIGRPSLSGEDDPAAEYFGVEAPRALDIVRDDGVGQHDPLWGGGSSAIWYLHWLGLVPRL